MDGKASLNNRFGQCLESGLRSSAQSGVYDLDDGPEVACLAEAAPLRRALEIFRGKLFPEWREADSAALLNQKRHRLLAQVAIVSGTGAIVFAILQIAVAVQAPTIQWLPLLLEVLAVFAGIAAVTVGLLTQRNKLWLCERHRAERLRMLKFGSLAWKEFARGDLALALAAIIPVLGLGARVWLGAFEPHRSANLFAAKRRAVDNMLLGIDESLDSDPYQLREQILHAEKFFESEHREWLRLMLETEWMI